MIFLKKKNLYDNITNLFVFSFKEDGGLQDQKGWRYDMGRRGAIG